MTGTDRQKSKGVGLQYLRDNLWKVLTLVSIVSFGLIRSIYVAEADILWQTKTGLDILSDGQFLRPDTYSWVAYGEEYVSNSWLWNVILAVLYSVFSFYGIAFATGLAVITLLFGVLWIARNRYASWPACFAVIAFIGITCNMWFSSRPQIADYLLLVAMIILIEKVNLDSWKKHVLVFGMGLILVALWNNLHLTGPVGALAFGGLYFLKQTNRVRSISGWRTLVKPFGLTALLGVVLALGCLATPYGLQGFLKPLVTSSASTGIINEWISPFRFEHFIHFLSAFAILVMIPVMIGLFRRRMLVEAVFMLFLVAVSSLQSRWTPFLIILAVPYLANALNTLIPKIKSRFIPYIKTAGVALVSVVAVSGLAAFIPQDRVSGAEYGFELAESVPAECKLFNVGSMGAPIILTRPEIKVSSDGRNDLYGWDEYVMQSIVSNDGEGTDEWLAENDITCVLLADVNLLNHKLSDDPDWVLVKADQHGGKLWVKKEIM